MNDLAPFLQGLGLGAGLIVAIGAQNAFVLRQGLARRHVFATAAVSTLSDALLIALGSAGFGGLIARVPALAAAATWGGALFLAVYGWRSLRSARSPAAPEAASAPAGPSGLRATVLTTLAFSLLNPHVYLDTVVLVGGMAAQYEGGRRTLFALGAMLASVLWFFGLAYGAGWLAPLFRRPSAWRALDIFVGCVMWTIAASLVATAISRV